MAPACARSPLEPRATTRTRPRSTASSIGARSILVAVQHRRRLRQLVVPTIRRIVSPDNAASVGAERARSPVRSDHRSNAQNTALRPRGPLHGRRRYSFFRRTSSAATAQFKAGLSLTHDHEAWYCDRRLKRQLRAGVRQSRRHCPARRWLPGQRHAGLSIRTWSRATIYLTDTWRLTDRLTANLGVRWDYQHVYLPEPSRDATPDFPTVWPAGDYPYDLVVVPERCRDSVSPTTAAAFHLQSVGGTLRLCVRRAAASATTRALRVGDVHLARSERRQAVSAGRGQPQSQRRRFRQRVNGAIGNVMNAGSQAAALFRDARASWEHPVAPNTAISRRRAYRRSSDNYDIPGPNAARPMSVYNIPMDITRRDPGPDGVLNNADDGGSFVLRLRSGVRGIAFVEEHARRTARSTTGSTPSSSR